VRKLRYLSFMSFTSIGWNLFPSLFPRGNHTPAVRQKAQAISEVPRAVTAHARAWIYLFIYSFIHSSNSVPHTEFSTGDSELNKYSPAKKR
jgi:hypothetical protein